MRRAVLPARTRSAHRSDIPTRTAGQPPRRVRASHRARPRPAPGGSRGAGGWAARSRPPLRRPADSSPPGTVSSVSHDRNVPQMRLPASPSNAAQTRRRSQRGSSSAATFARSGRSRNALLNASTNWGSSSAPNRADLELHRVDPRASAVTARRPRSRLVVRCHGRTSAVTRPPPARPGRTRARSVA